jgi:hypothetical protein
MTILTSILTHLHISTLRSQTGGRGESNPCLLGHRQTHYPLCYSHQANQKRPDLDALQIGPFVKSYSTDSGQVIRSGALLAR